MTTEHFTLQSARSIINAEIVSRVNIYFTTLSSVLIAGAFLAQIRALGDLLSLFIWIAFPVIILLGFFTLARLMVLGRMDFIYIRAINRIRQFYVQATPEARDFLLFPPHDDDGSARVYGGYTLSFRGNLLSAAHAVTIINTILVTVLLSGLLSQLLEMTTPGFLPIGLGIFVLVYFLHGFLGAAFSKMDVRPEYLETRFPAAAPDPNLDTPS